MIHHTPTFWSCIYMSYHTLMFSYTDVLIHWNIIIHWSYHKLTVWSCIYLSYHTLTSSYTDDIIHCVLKLHLSESFLLLHCYKQYINYALRQRCEGKHEQKTLCIETKDTPLFTHFITLALPHTLYQTHFITHTHNSSHTHSHQQSIHTTCHANALTWGSVRGNKGWGEAATLRRATVKIMHTHSAEMNLMCMATMVLKIATADHAHTQYRMSNAQLQIMHTHSAELNLMCMATMVLKRATADHAHTQYRLSNAQLQIMHTQCKIKFDVNGYYGAQTRNCRSCTHTVQN